MMRAAMPRLVLVVLAAVALWGRASSQDPTEIAREVVGSGGYQTELPGRQDGPGAIGTGSRRREPRRVGVAPDEPFAREGIGLLLWIVLGVVLVAIVGSLVWNSTRAGRDVDLVGRRPRVPKAVDPAAAFDPGAIPLDEAQRLAQQGRFGEAIRILLLRTLDALRARGGFTMAPWMTSREVLRRAPLEERSRTGLRALVDAVERSLFARHEPGADEFEVCARAYQALVDDAGGGRPA